MDTTPDRGAHFLSLHQPGRPLLMPNAWDIGSAVLLASLGFEALATTSGGFAATRGRLDGSMSADEVLAHVHELAGATELPLSADLENCFAHEPDGVAATIGDAIDAGVAGCSVEDYSGDPDDPIYNLDLAAARVRAAAEAAVRAIPGVTMAMAVAIWPTPSPACRRTRRPGRTCCSLPSSWIRASCASCSTQWTGPSASW